MSAIRKRYRILVIEDNETDAELIGKALQKYDVEHELVTLSDGEKALRYLDTLTSVPVPDLIVLDINMPRRDGLTVLVQYRMNVCLVRVPIIVLTSSDAPSDKTRAGIIGVSAFLQKPLLLEDFLALGERFKTILGTPFTFADAQSTPPVQDTP
ncbi:MAG: response regulator [Acidobacteriota bacterium]|nr:response regulator [Acidobacteriota bacterium]